jgi:outer membrane protein
MTRWHRSFLKTALLCCAVAAMTTPAYAQEQGEWRYGFRLINIGVDSSTEKIFDTDSKVTFDSRVSADFDITYMLGQTWAMEWMITAAPHEVSVQSGIFDGLDLGSVWVSETSLTFQYVFSLWGPWRPYLGAGIGLASFITSSTSDAAEAIGVDDLKSDIGFGLVGQVGVAYRLNKTWMLNFDVKYFNIPLEVELKGNQGTSAKVEMDWQPLIIGLGGAARF